MPAKFSELTKVDRRKQWKGLKDKHNKAIAKAKLNFDQKLGPALDKYQTQVDKLTALAGKGELNTIQVQPVLECAWALEKIVESYKGQLKTLEEPAKKELTGVLAAIENDIDSWKALATATSGTPSKGTTAAQKEAATDLRAILDNIRAMCLTIVTRGPRAKASYEKPNLRKQAAAMVSEMVESARLAGSASHELANLASKVNAGTNYDLFKTRAKAAAPLIQRTRDAAHAFKSAWNFSLEINTVSSDTDAMALKGNYEQIVSDFDAALELIRKLP